MENKGSLRNHGSQGIQVLRNLVG